MTHSELVRLEEEVKTLKSVVGILYRASQGEKVTNEEWDLAIQVGSGVYEDELRASLDK